jgi:prepilin-type N-terminal cleavage/methylation domain-containing protein/prepilin-type processing-associated H-X9-DG protein
MCNKKKMSRQNGFVEQGFTLIEILVVLAIIIILAAILFPVLARARESARRANCINNEKQISLGLMMYVQDYDECFPPQYGTPVWPNLLQPYIEAYGIMRCPSSPVAKQLATDVKNGYSQTYGLTGGITGIYIQAGYPVRHLAAITEPSRSFMVVESRFAKPTALTAGTPSDLYAVAGYGVSSVNFGYPVIARPEDNQNFDDTRHFDGSDVGFCDGHVKWVKSGQGNQYIWNLPDVRFSG